jgi:hypothetical protein
VRIAEVVTDVRKILAEMEKVREQMKRRPSKHRHLADLQRQRDQCTEILSRA